MQKEKKVRVVLLVLFVGMLATPVTIMAASGKISCDPADMAKMSPPERKRAEMICAKMAERKVKDEKQQAERDERFDKFVKGHKAMEQVCNDHQKRLPTNSEKRGDKIIWTYMTKTTNAIFSECEEFVFKNNGDDLVSTRKYRCE